jgi:CBS domain-containing protein
MAKNTFQTTALIVILHEPNLLPKLLAAWKRARVPGVTILPSMGGFQAQKQARRGSLSGLINMFTQDDPGQRTLMSLIDDQQTLERAIAEADRVVKGFDSPRSGILFTFPIGNVLGLQKWRETDVEHEPEDQQEKEPSNLMKWFEEDVKASYGKDALHDWTSQRKKRVSDIIQLLSLDTAIVRVDTPIPKVFASMLEKPNTPLACVTNTEQRLMGTIHISTLADILMAPVVPEAYIENSDEYDKALAFADPEKIILAADIMSEPVYAMLDQSLEDAFQRMKKHKLAGLPVVDQSYHVKGYLSLLELVAICFPEPGKAIN